MKDYDSSYEDLLEKFGYSYINLTRARTLCIEIYKTFNKLNPGYMNDIFKLRNTDRLTQEKYKLNLKIPKTNQVTFVTRSLRSCSLKILNALPYNRKSSENPNSFKIIIKCYDGTHTSSR